MLSQQLLRAGAILLQRLTGHVKVKLMLLQDYRYSY